MRARVRFHRGSFSAWYFIRPRALQGTKWLFFAQLGRLSVEVRRRGQ